MIYILLFLLAIGVFTGLIILALKITANKVTEATNLVRVDLSGVKRSQTYSTKREQKTLKAVEKILKKVEKVSKSI